MSKDICFNQGTQFCFACYSSGLIHNGPANWSFLNDRGYARIILLLLFTMKFFCISFRINFFKKLFFFAFWCKKIKRYSVSSILQGLQSFTKYCIYIYIYIYIFIYIYTLGKKDINLQIQNRKKKKKNK